MRPPNPRLADNGTGRDTLRFFTIDIDPTTAADAEGNWTRPISVGTNYTAIVTPSMATGIDGNGSELSITTYECMLYTSTPPLLITDSPVEWSKAGVALGTLVPLGEAAPAAAGAWAFTAKMTGPNPDDGTGKPYGAP